MSSILLYYTVEKGDTIKERKFYCRRTTWRKDLTHSCIFQDLETANRVKKNMKQITKGKIQVRLWRLCSTNLLEEDNV